MPSSETSAVPENCWKCGRQLGNARTVNGGRSFHPECDPVLARLHPAGEAVAWQAVPHSPSMAMLNAAVDHTGAGSGMDWNGLSPQSLFHRAWFAMLAAAPHPAPTAADTPFPQGISKETQDALDAIDANIRNAAVNAKNIFVGAADTPEGPTQREEWLAAQAALDRNSVLLLEKQLSSAHETIRAMREALEHARHVMWEYGFSEDELRPIRDAIALAAEEMPDGQ